MSAPWAPTMTLLAKSILKRLQASSPRNKRVTEKAIQDSIKYLSYDAAQSLRDHGKFTLSGFGRFELSRKSGKVVFHPRDSFLNQMEAGEEFERSNEKDE